MKKFSFSRDAYVTASSMCDGAGVFAFGDGSIAKLYPPYDEPKIVQAAVSVIHALSPQGKEILFGDESGQLKSMKDDGTLTQIHQFQHAWIEHIVFNPKRALSAAVAGKTVALWDGKVLRQFSDHPSTISGVAFAPKGNRIAAAHYNGVTIWSKEIVQPVQKLSWKGSHISITWSPDMRHIVTGTQEMELHVFDLSNNQHLRMTGFEAKVRSFSWNRKGDILFTSGSSQALGWNFRGKGPEGKAPLSFGPEEEGLVTQVSCHPQESILAAGYDSGLILLIDIETGKFVPVFKRDGDAITCCNWDLKSDYLTYGTRQGYYGIIQV